MKRRNIFIILPVLSLLLLFVVLWGGDNDNSRDITDIGENTGLEDATIEIEKVKDISEFPTPFLERELSELTPETLSYLEELTHRINNDTYDVGAWIEIGGVWKSGGDFDGAREAWEYALLLNPKSIITLVNLGNLEYRQFGNYSKAEGYYLSAIRENPSDIVAYLQITELYKYGFKDISRAILVVDGGLELVPGNKDLLELKSMIKEGKI